MCNNLSDNESNTSELPPDHEARMERALLSLDGLSVGDAFGEGCFGSVRRMQRQELPPSPWCFTDDTAMARSIVRCLNRYGHEIGRASCRERVEIWEVDRSRKNTRNRGCEDINVEEEEEKTSPRK